MGTVLFPFFLTGKYNIAGPLELVATFSVVSNCYWLFFVVYILLMSGGEVAGGEVAGGEVEVERLQVERLQVERLRS